MKRIIQYTLFLTAIVLLTVSACSVDTVIGKVLSTDIRAYINGYEIPAYNIDGNIAVIVSDLNDYGFVTSYDEEKRQSSVALDPNDTEFEDTEYSCYYGTYTVGVPIMNVYSTDITVMLEGVETEGFNVNGQMAVYLYDLGCFGSYCYDDLTRSSSLTLPGYKVKEKQIDDNADADIEEATKNMTFKNSPLGYPVLTENTTVLYGGSYNLKIGVMGYRVRCVQRYLGQQCEKYGMYGYTTSYLVSAFQQNNNLPVTGEVDLATWIAMGYTEKQWREWDTYVHPSEVTEDMTREDIINKFIEIAYTYLGSEYIFGCAGSPEQGGDCSGFVLSCLYGIGINPEGYDPQQHNFNEYNSRLMWADEHFKKVDYSDRQVGDLIFYYNPNGVIVHVAIYLGNDLCIESCRNTIEVLSIYKYSMSIAGVRRVIY